MEYNISFSKIISSVFWKLTQTVSSQAVAFVVSIILARLLTPEDYGVTGLLAVFITISNTFITGGFGVALIQKKSIDDEDLSSVFYIMLITAALCYIVLYFSAPFIAAFYKIPVMVDVLRVLSITLFLGSVTAVQEAALVRKFNFKLLFNANLISTIISGLVAVLMAYTGYGVWALVIMQLLNSLIVMIILLFTVKWRPKLVFSLQKIKGLFSFGWKQLVSNLITTIYDGLYSLIIGKSYSTQLLGYYTKGQQVPKLLIGIVDNTIIGSMFPVLSAVQDDKKSLKALLKNLIVISTYFLFPAIVGLIVVAEPLVLILFGKSWMQTVPFLQISAAGFVLWALHTSNAQMIKAIGRSDLFLKLGLYKRIIGIALLLLSLRFGIYAMLWSFVLTSIIGCFIHAVPSKQLVGYGILEQLQDILPSVILSIVMGCAIYPLSYFISNDVVLLISQVLAGLLIYVLGSVVFKLKSLDLVIDGIKKARNMNSN